MASPTITLRSGEWSRSTASRTRATSNRESAVGEWNEEDAAD
jgi:hypothetical protein